MAFPGSLFGSMFGGADPFAQMDAHFRAMTQQMGFGDPFFGQPSQQPLPQRASRGPQIEEVGSDEEGSGHPVSSGQPYVEEASDEDDPHQNNRRARRARHNSPPAQQQQQQQQQQQVSMPGFGGGFGSLFGNFPNLSAMANAPGATGFSYSTTSFQSSGPNGLNYQAAQSTRAGPNGVRESHAAFHDGRTGRRDVRITRGIKDRERILHRIRDATGREDAEEILKGMSQEEVDRFDREWQEQAEKNLMWGGGRRGPTLGYQQQQQQQSTRPALGYQQQQQQQQSTRPALASSTSANGRGAYGGSAPAYGYGSTPAYGGAGYGGAGYSSTGGVGTGGLGNGTARGSMPAYGSAGYGGTGYGTTGGMGTGGLGNGTARAGGGYATSPPGYARSTSYNGGGAGMTGSNRGGGGYVGNGSAYAGNGAGYTSRSYGPGSTSSSRRY
ncbi:hypothetical protein DUNSADRAFT_15491 [Dunaliella salina]|uniref:Uncharacterized protein n=1 Tax=Dunaliella salina TaxID=3046 RepID=A0ABQ7H1Q2_DUNSA|nr:hypothetical protein DUNSADRAFT_15491 [Dunaliella salina]|eukprot:KAF5840781.1 hypothetical protein DUNSADRAFT_15491 [Dunaliella salina]